MVRKCSQSICRKNEQILQLSLKLIKKYSLLNKLNNTIRITI